jgi:hypothetical protein
MNKLRAIVFASVVGVSTLAAGGGVVACGGSWWSNFTNDPVQNVQVFEQGVQIAVSDAQIAWTLVQPFLPPAQLTQINQQFENAIAAINHGLRVLNDAVTAAVAAHTPNPDFTALMAAVTDAVQQVLAIIAEYTVTPPADAGAPVVADGGAAASASGKAPASQAYLDAQAMLVALKQQAHAH